MKKKILTSIIGTISIFSLNVNKVNADTVTADTETELVNFVNTAFEDRTILLSENFPQNILSTIELKETTDYSITIDGQNKVLTSSTANPIISYNSGGSINPGYLKIENMDFEGNGANVRAFNVGGYKGTFELNNVSVNNFHAGDDGGAMYMGGNTVIINSTFSNNTSNASGYSGGAIGSKGFSGSLVIENSIFENNETLALGTGPVGGEGGAIYVYSPTATASFSFKNNIFDSNNAVKNASVGKTTLADGGAIALFNVLPGMKIDFDENTFMNNVAGDNGGAILIQTNDSISTGISFKNNTFYKNISQGTTAGTASGGAIQIYSNGGMSTSRVAKVDFINNSFVDNEAKYTGGAIGLAGVAIFNGSSGNFKNNLFAGNISSMSTDKDNDAVATSGFSSSIQKLGYEIGLNDGTTKQDIVGKLPIKLIDNYNEKKAGSKKTQRTIPTIPILPEGKADSIVTSDDTSTNDQRGIIRNNPSDAGSIEMSWIKYDANGGEFNFSSLPNFYDGQVYYDNNVTKNYYQIGIDPSKKVVPNGETDLGVKRNDYTFLGWSKDQSATVADKDLEAGVQLDLKQTNIDFYNKTIYAVWKENSVAGADVTVKYQDTKGKEIYPDEVLTGKIGEEYEAKAKDIKGYTLKETPSNATGKFSNKAQTVIFVYTKNPVAGPAAPYDPTDPTQPPREIEENPDGPGTSGVIRLERVPTFDFGEIEIKTNIEPVEVLDELYTAKGSGEQFYAAPTVEITDDQGSAPGWELSVTNDGVFKSTSSTVPDFNATITINDAVAAPYTSGVTLAEAPEILKDGPITLNKAQQPLATAEAGKGNDKWGISFYDSTDATASKDGLPVRKIGTPKRSNAIVLNIPSATKITANITYTTDIEWTLSTPFP